VLVLRSSTSSHHTGSYRAQANPAEALLAVLLTSNVPNPPTPSLNQCLLQCFPKMVFVPRLFMSSLLARVTIRHRPCHPLPVQSSVPFPQYAALRTLINALQPSLFFPNLSVNFFFGFGTTSAPSTGDPAVEGVALGTSPIPLNPPTLPATGSCFTFTSTSGGP